MLFLSSGTPKGSFLAAGFSVRRATLPSPSFQAQKRLQQRKAKEAAEYYEESSSSSSSSSWSSWSIDYQNGDSTTITTTDELYCWHPIDYSAANEYIQEHYHHVNFGGGGGGGAGFGGCDSKLYFENGAGSDPFDESNHDRNKPIEPIYNARDGILLGTTSTTATTGTRRQLRSAAVLDRDGFTLIDAPSSVTDYTDLQQIKQRYIPELRRIILNMNNDLSSSFQEQDDEVEVDDTIDHIFFWNPVYRGENQTVTNAERNMDLSTPPTSPTAGMVHVDTDVGAYHVQQLINLIQKNQITTCSSDDDDDLDSKELINLIESGRRRFAILNFWRNADTNNPIQRQPLAVFSPHYYNNGDNHTDCATTGSRHNQYFPVSKPDPGYSRWYTYPNMTTNEVLVFKQYDRDGSYPSDIWHCALKSIVPANQPSRISFDIRAFIIYKSKVTTANDRYSEDRIRPILTLEESGAFCNEQAQKRGLHTS